MPRRFGRLPPLSALEGFESAARLGSFSLAAQELSITQSAVSHQVRSLEEFFGLALFNRVGRSVELTVAGIDFLGTCGEALELLSRGKRRMDFYFRPGSVVWGTSPAFAGKWLLPRYPAMRAAIAEIQPWLFSSDEVFALDAQEVDLAIWFGDGHWHGVHCDKLFHDYLVPMHSPKLLPLASPLRNAADLEAHMLLHDERGDDWLRWLNTFDEGGECDTTQGCNFSDSGLVLDAAAAGHGVALGSRVLASDQLRSGVLAEASDLVLKTSEAWYLVYPEGQVLRPAVEQAQQWLLQVASEFREQLIPGAA
jgi:LysR family glycine cleavage system transcriptional activator